MRPRGSHSTFDIQHSPFNISGARRGEASSTRDHPRRTRPPNPNPGMPHPPESVPTPARQHHPRMSRIRAAPQQAVVAQLVEQLIRNQQVAGSNPANGSKLLKTLMLLILKSHT